MTSERAKLLDAALDYNRRGWSVIPTYAKKAAVQWKKCQQQPPTETELCQWFSNGISIDGIAVVLGKVSGELVCRDYDQMDGYLKWAAEHSELANTLPTVETSRGRHVYFRSAWNGFIKFNDGELRGSPGQYCVLPPSVHPSGTLYRWLIDLPKNDLILRDPFETGFLSRATETQRHRDTDDTEIQSNKGVLDNLSELIEKAIRETMPSEIGQRNPMIFEYARALKAIPTISDACVADLRDYVKDWHVQALPIIGTKPFDDTWADFTHSWKRVRFPRGQFPMAEIVRRAESENIPSVAEQYDAPETRKLISICRELQRSAGTRPFFISCRTAGQLVGMDYTTASRRLGMLVTDGVLEVAQAGDLTHATRYRYLAEI